MPKLTYQNYNGYQDGGTGPAIGFDSEAQKTSTIANANKVPALQLAVEALQGLSLSDIASANEGISFGNPIAGKTPINANTEVQATSIVTVGSENVIGTKLDNTGNVQFTKSLSGLKGQVTLNKTDVGLDNVDNTSDLSKPISTLTQSALDNKQIKISNGWDTSSFAVSGSNNVYVTGISKQGISEYKKYDDIQNTLISGTNIKTVGGISLLGSGDIPIPKVPNVHNVQANQSWSNCAVLLLGSVFGVPLLSATFEINGTFFQIGNNINGDDDSKRVSQKTATCSSIGSSFYINNISTGSTWTASGNWENPTRKLDVIQGWTLRIEDTHVTFIGNSFVGSDPKCTIDYD